jgi:hypothetical protein
MPKQKAARPVRRKGLSTAEIAQQDGAQLPDREAMSLVNANIAVPINLAAALNVLSDGSIAAAAANQDTPIDQGTGGAPAPAPAETTTPAPTP